MAKEYIEKAAFREVLRKSHEYHASNCRESVLLDRDIRLLDEQPAADVVEVAHNMTEFKKVWYHFFTGKNGKREHLELKLLCTKCNHVWDRQAYAFRFCPNCGRRVVEITNEGNGDNDDR